MPKIEKPPSRRTRRRRAVAAVAGLGATEQEREAVLARMFPRRRYNSRTARAALESIGEDDLPDYLDTTRRAFLDLARGRGQAIASIRTVAAAVGISEKLAAFRLRLLIAWSGARPLSDWPAAIERERRRAKKEGRPFSIETHETPTAADSPGWAVFYGRLAEEMHARGSTDYDLYDLVVALWESAPALCRGCGAPLLPERFPGDPNGLPLQPGADLCPGKNERCRAKASRRSRKAAESASRGETSQGPRKRR